MTTEQATENAAENGTEKKHYNGRLTFYHANAKGTGAAVRLELKIHTDAKSGNGCFFLEMAQQKTTATRTREDRTPATFDWASKATVRLDFADVCEFLTVLEGRQPQVGGQRNGLYHEAKGLNTMITFKCNEERGGYNLAISRKRGEEQVFRGHILISASEGVGLRSVFQAGLFYMAFHQSIAPAA